METLVVGIDIGKETHYARAFDYRGIELAKLLRFSNTAQGYKALDERFTLLYPRTTRRSAIRPIQRAGSRLLSGFVRPDPDGDYDALSKQKGNTCLDFGRDAYGVKRVLE